MHTLFNRKRQSGFTFLDPSCCERLKLNVLKTSTHLVCRAFSLLAVLGYSKFIWTVHSWNGCSAPFSRFLHFSNATLMADSSWPLTPYFSLQVKVFLPEKRRDATCCLLHSQIWGVNFHHIPQRGFMQREHKCRSKASFQFAWHSHMSNEEARQVSLVSLKTSFKSIEQHWRSLGTLSLQQEILMCSGVADVPLSFSLMEKLRCTQINSQFITLPVAQSKWGLWSMNHGWPKIRGSKWDWLRWK